MAKATERSMLQNQHPVTINRAELFAQIRDMTDSELSAFAGECLQGVKWSNGTHPQRMARIFEILLVTNEVCKTPLGDIEENDIPPIGELLAMADTSTGGYPQVKSIIRGDRPKVLNAARELYTLGELGFGLTVLFACLRIARCLAQKSAKPTNETPTE